MQYGDNGTVQQLGNLLCVYVVPYYIQKCVSY